MLTNLKCLGWANVIYLVAPVLGIVLHTVLGTQWISVEQELDEWMKLPLSVPMESSATRQLNVCLTSSALFFIMNSSDPLPFDRLILSMPTRKLVFVSESVTPWCDFLEARRSFPAGFQSLQRKWHFSGMPWRLHLSVSCATLACYDTSCLEACW